MSSRTVISLCASAIVGIGCRRWFRVTPWHTAPFIAAASITVAPIAVAPIAPVLIAAIALAPIVLEWPRASELPPLELPPSERLPMEPTTPIGLMGPMGADTTPIPPATRHLTPESSVAHGNKVCVRQASWIT